MRPLLLTASLAVASCVPTPANRQAVEPTLRGARSEHASCYRNSPTGQHGIAATVQLNWTVTPTGQAEHVEALAHPADEELEACSRRVLERLEFPGAQPGDYSVVIRSSGSDPDTLL